MLLINRYGRVVDVAESLAQELLADPNNFEIYTGQIQNRWGNKAYGDQLLPRDILDQNLEENNEFNHDKIKWPREGGYPVEGAFSQQIQDEREQKDAEIAELRKLLKQTSSQYEPKSINCIKCGKQFIPMDKRWKTCNNCRD